MVCIHTRCSEEIGFLLTVVIFVLVTPPAVVILPIRR